MRFFLKFGCYQLLGKGKVRTFWRERPPARGEKEGMRGVAMKRWKNSACFGRERRVPLERPRGRGSFETARAVASSVTGVDLSSSHMSPSPTHLSLFIAVGFFFSDF